ncbi:insulin-induced gene 2 protein-like [Watersipora subatra]|uniref:insulin-induced gene 2 protein-like n=1 Tax=Watersipora subatra TaxID=2589382 RepID=UPI00355B6CB6
MRREYFISHQLYRDTRYTLAAAMVKEGTSDYSSNQFSDKSCQNCLSSQSIFGTSKHFHKTRRSHSFPGNAQRLIAFEEPKKSHNTSIIKRWHSIPALYSNKLTDTLHFESTSTGAGAFKTGCYETVIHKRQSPSLTRRIFCLFSLGAFLALLLNYLQKQKKVTVFSPGLFGDNLNSAWWMPPTFGLAATVIGLVYPKLDQLLGDKKSFRYEWAGVMRCIALFVGINHASARIDFDSNTHLFLTLTMLSFGLWYFFDQSIAGLGLGLLTASIATAITQILVAMDVFGYSNPDFIYMQSWVPCLYFSGVVTMGACGRALAPLDARSRVHHHLD